MSRPCGCRASAFARRYPARDKHDDHSRKSGLTLPLLYPQPRLRAWMRRSLWSGSCCDCDAGRGPCRASEEGLGPVNEVVRDHGGRACPCLCRASRDKTTGDDQSVVVCRARGRLDTADWSRARGVGWTFSLCGGRGLCLCLSALGSRLAPCGASMGRCRCHRARRPAHSPSDACLLTR